ncbi:MAG: endonuclease MutS2 [Desulfotomaculaceae bacterium]|nr:endonuclease MutS2 [Desulfotomaculaceae bacterium]
MDKRTLVRLEYDKVKKRLAAHAGSSLGKERVLKLEPVDNPLIIYRWQAETSEGRELLRLDPLAEFGGWRDVRLQLQRAGRGALLDPEELLAVADTLTAGRVIKRFLQEKQERYPILSELGLSLASLPDLERKIKQAILPGGEVANGASAALAQIRRKLAGAQSQIKEHLEHVIRSPHYQKYLQDPIVTVREGRYVVPVKIEYRAQVPGIVHDQSASGATLFVEPMAVVDKNNELRSLIVAEKQEVSKILAELSAQVAQHAETLGISLEALGDLDFIMARAHFSQKLNALAPVIEGEANMNIRLARHPLLQGNVVPVDLRLGEDFDTLVITGPNTGGKTVALKTAGLMVLMAQSGLHLPAEEGSKLGIFKQVFTDIGDEQSIEQSLSTFSSHMSNIVQIVSSAGRDSLVLLDELGAGTDPAEGAALAQAILEKLHLSGAKTIATTHYSELKNFAYLRERVENASVEFDVATLRPTFRLLIGRPGRSNAFEIATRLGLPEELVGRAREFLTVEQVRVDELMQNLERTQQEAEANRRETTEMIEKARALKDKYEKMEFDLAQRRESILAKAGEEARALVKSARLEAEETIKTLREKLALEAAQGRESAIQEARENFVKLHKKVKRAVPKKVVAGTAPSTLQNGEEVYLPEYNRHGFVLAPPGPDGEVLVQVGVIKINVPLKALRLAEKTKPAVAKSDTARLALDKAREISAELHLRGLYADDALFEVEKYLDNAFLAGLPQVRLIHGKGTGSLRAAIHKYLHGHHRVKSYRLGEQGEGGFGVTVVELAL